MIDIKLMENWNWSKAIEDRHDNTSIDEIIRIDAERRPPS